MGYHKANGQFANVVDISLPSTEGLTLTADGYSRVVELGDRAVARLALVTGAHSSGDTLDVDVECSRDGVNDWYVVGSFTQTTAASTERKVFPLDRFMRVKYNVTGSGVSIPALVSGEAA